MIYDEKYKGFYAITNELFDVPEDTSKEFLVEFSKNDLNNIQHISRKVELLLTNESMAMEKKEITLLEGIIPSCLMLKLYRVGHGFYVVSNDKIAQIVLFNNGEDKYCLHILIECLINSKTWRKLQEKEENLKINFDETREDFPVYAKELFEIPNDCLQHFEIKYSQKDLGNMASISKRTESQLNYEGMAMEKSDFEKLDNSLAQSPTIEEGATRNSFYLISNRKLAKIDIRNEGNGCFAICVAFDNLFHSDTWYRNHSRWF
ncbi:MAG: hypothetical protein K6G50_02230 [bacterium]|nr:hypothetical protein [bacterium]